MKIGSRVLPTQQHESAKERAQFIIDLIKDKEYERAYNELEEMGSDVFRHPDYNVRTDTMLGHIEASKLCMYWISQSSETPDEVERDTKRAIEELQTIE